MKKPVKPEGRVAKPVVFIVGADKGGVGKTTLCRLLVNYLTRNQVSVRAFDGETPRGSLVRFHPKVTKVIDIGSVADQMSIFDGLSGEAKCTLVDLKAGTLSSTLVALKEVGFLDAARNGEFTLRVWHVIGPSVASLEEVKWVSDMLADDEDIVVKNFINESKFFEWDEGTTKQLNDNSGAAPTVTVPKLHEIAFEHVDVASVSFDDFIANRTADGGLTNHSFVVRGYVRKWVADVEKEFDRIRVLDLFR